MQRFGQIIGVKADQIEAYEHIHAAVWPEVLDMIQRCNMRNYSIFRHEQLLFAYFEYVGEDLTGRVGALGSKEGAAIAQFGQLLGSREGGEHPVKCGRKI